MLQQLTERLAVVQTKPHERHVPTWQLEKRQRASKGGAAASAELPAGAEPGVLSVVLPKWRAGMSPDDARLQQRQRQSLGKVRREEETKMTAAAEEIAAAIESNSQVRDPLWTT